MIESGPTSCSTLTEYIPEVQKYLADAKETAKLFEEAEIRPSFYKYDVDGSGTIDKDELRTCLEDLGYNMNDNQLDKAY